MKTKRILAQVFYALQVTKLAQWWHRKYVIILNYHGVSDEGSEYDTLDLNVSLENFRSQMAYLKRGHHVISLREFLSALEQNTRLPNYSVVLTFDDGYKDFLAVVPLLIDERLPATLFLVTDMMQEARIVSEKDNGKTRLSWADVNTLDKHNLFEFGSHTCSHFSLPNLAPAVFDYEVRESLTTLQAQVKNVVPALAYPNGAYKGISDEQLKEAGYTCALTIDPGPNCYDANHYFLRRQTIRGDDNQQMFAARVSCLTDSFYSGRALLRTLIAVIQSLAGAGTVLRSD